MRLPERLCPPLGRQLVGADHLAHGHHDVPWSLEAVARVRHEHVVEHDHVALLPLEAHGDLLEDLAQVLHRLVGMGEPSP